MPDGRPFDPESLGDPVATRTQWAPIAGGTAANFCTHVLAERGPDRTVFRATAAQWAFSSIFAAFGAVFAGVGLQRWLWGTPSQAGSGAVATVVSLVFLVPGLVMLWRSAVPIAFDRAAGTFSKPGKPGVRLADVHALQLVAVEVRAKTPYLSYDLCVVTPGGDRVFVVGHGGRTQLQRDAARLAARLGVPLWDATPNGAQRRATARRR